MKIAILSEAFTLTPILDALKKLGDVIVYDDTTTDETMIERCAGVDIALLNCWVSPLSHRVLDGLQSVCLIVTNTTGYEQIDTAYARSKGIAVANVPGFGTESVGELAIALMFAVDRMIPLGDTLMKQQPFWVDPQQEDMHVFKGHTLKDRTMGIIGLGTIGQRVAQMAQALGMKTIAYNRTQRNIPHIGLCSVDEVFQQSDVISINIAAAPETEHIVNEHTLSLMKPEAILINTARDGAIDIDALYHALSKKQIRGAGLDGIGLSSKDHPILSLPNLVLTPHIGWYTHESELNIASIVLDTVRSFLDDKELNIVN